jgi:hypothetical protein
MISGDDMDAETREAIRVIKAAGNEEEVTEALKKAGVTDIESMPPSRLHLPRTSHESRSQRGVVRDCVRVSPTPKSRDEL